MKHIKSERKNKTNLRSKFAAQALHLSQPWSSHRHHYSGRTGSCTTMKMAMMRQRGGLPAELLCAERRVTTTIPKVKSMWWLMRCRIVLFCVFWGTCTNHERGCLRPHAEVCCKSSGQHKREVSFMFSTAAMWASPIARVDAQFLVDSICSHSG